MNSRYVKSYIDEYFGKGDLMCAESVAKLVAEAGNRDGESLVPLATGFCAGMARSRGQCGAVSGAALAMGLYAGRRLGGDPDPAFVLVQTFVDRFRERYHSINCFELTGCDFTTAEGQQRFREQGGKRHCMDMAAGAVDLALSILREHGYLGDTDHWQGPAPLFVSASSDDDG